MNNPPYNVVNTATLVRRQDEIVVIGPLREGRLDLPLKAMQYLRNYTTSRTRYVRTREPSLLRSYSKQVLKSLNELQPDIILALGTLPISFLDSEVPIALWSGSTWVSMQNYYPEFSSLSSRSLKTGAMADRNAISRCARVLPATKWAQESFVEDYGVNPLNTMICPWGAREPQRPVTAKLVSERLEKPHLLSIGRSWERKGMDDLLALAANLRRRDIPIEVDIAGCLPPVGRHLPEYVHIHGWLDKNDASDCIRLDQLLRSATVMAVFSRAEAYGQVVNEAAAYGVPVIATRTGGLADAVASRKLGVLVEQPVDSEITANAFQRIIADPASYHSMFTNLLRTFRRDLSWSATVTKAINFATLGQ